MAFMHDPVTSMASMLMSIMAFMSFAAPIIAMCGMFRCFSDSRRALMLGVVSVPGMIHWFSSLRLLVFFFMRMRVVIVMLSRCVAVFARRLIHFLLLVFRPLL
jgi:hypothetical protein